MRTSVFVNDYDLSLSGFILEKPEGWLDAVAVRDRVSQLPGRSGVVVMPPPTETSPRSMVITGVVKPTPKTSAQVRLALADIKDRFARDTVEIRFNDDPTKVFFARYESFVNMGVAPEFSSPFTRIQVRLTCPDPLVYDRDGTAVGFTTVRAPLPLGTGPSAPVVQIMGAVTNPILTYRNAAGEVVGTMGFTIVLAATDFLEIDSELGTVKKSVSGVITNAIDTIASGDFPLLDPKDGDYPNSVWPTLEVSGGTGVALYRRTWQ